MNTRINGVYETTSGRRYVVVGTATDSKKRKVVVFYRLRRQDEWFTVPVESWNSCQLKYIGDLIIK